MSFSQHLRWGATRRVRIWKSRGRAHRHPAGFGSSLSADLEGSIRSEQWEEQSEALLQFQCVCVSECVCIICVRLDICVLWREGSNYSLGEELGRLGQCWETEAQCRTVPETGGLMEIQKDLGSAFILNVHHLVGWKENPLSWRKLNWQMRHWT